MKKRFEASMILAAAGDAIGFKNGKWEFLKNGTQIHSQYKALGGLENIDVSARSSSWIFGKTKSWMVSDDTVMHLATSEVLTRSKSLPFDQTMNIMVANYIGCMSDMNGRAAGMKCVSILDLLRQSDGVLTWDQLKYDRTGGGCGGSMRAMCIGLRWAGEQNRKELIRTAIESGRVTHNHVNGFMGSLVSALFTSFAIEDIPTEKWGYLLLNTIMPLCKQYLQYEAKRDWPQISEDLKAFQAKFEKYLQTRNIHTGNNLPTFPDQYDVATRDKFYDTLSFDGWAGSSGDDSVMIAYDALLGSNNDWKELIERAALHYGDSDSTGTIAGAWYGAKYGYPDQKYQKNWVGIEYEDRLKHQAHLLYEKYNSANH